MAYLKMEEILNLKKWQELQDALAEVTRLAIITVDYKGVPFSQHSNCTPFCEMVRNDERLLENCKKCDSRAGLEAVRSNRPYIYLCHYNVIDIAIPVISEDKYVGAVMAGQVKLADLDDAPKDLEQIFHSNISMRELQCSPELKALYDQIPTLDYHTILTASKMLLRFCNYIVEEANDKNLLLEMYENLATNTGHLPAETIPSVKMKEVRDALSNALTCKYLNIKAPDATNIRNKKLIPAFDFIYSNPGEMLSLVEAAEICHLSPSYYSRCFYKEVGENYTTYITQLKVEWAKQLLLGTDLSVTQISDELGFGEPGYFIKIFKKSESVTPALYRRFIVEKKQITT